MTRAQICVAASIAVFVWQGSAIDKSLVSDRGLREAFAVQHQNEGVSLSTSGRRSDILVVTTTNAQDSGTCSETLDVIGRDGQFLDQVAALGFTAVECVSYNGNDLQLTSFEKRIITPRNPSLPWRKRADA